MERLLKEEGVTRANVSMARGSEIGDESSRKRKPLEVEKEVLTVVVKPAIAEEVFDLIFREADVNRPGGGIMFMSRISLSTALVLEEAQEYETKEAAPPPKPSQDLPH